MARLDINSLTLWITAAAAQHPRDLADQVAQRLGVTRRTANTALGRLVQSQWLVRQGTPRKPVFAPGLLRQVARRYALAGLEEDIPWARDFAPHLDLPSEVRRITQHMFCELVNNLSRLNQVWVATARPERWRKLSTDWLVRHKVSVMGLLMRRNDDFRQAPAVKLTQAAEKFTRVEKVSLVIDSRDDVLGAFRGAGVSALQSMAVAR